MKVTIGDFIKRITKGGVVKLITLFVAFLLAISYCVIWPVINNANEQTVISTVTRVERVTYGHLWNRHKYLIYTIDQDDTSWVFENTDNSLRGKYNSSDVYARIKEGTTYQFFAVGYRIPLFSLYSNVITLKEVHND